MPSTVAVTLAASLAVTAPSSAAPTRVRAFIPAMSLVSGRAAHSAVPRYHAIPFAYHRLAGEAAPLKAFALVLKPAPLVLKPQPIAVLPAFLPRLGVASFLSLLDPAECTRPSRGVLIAALPATPISPIACQGESPGHERAPWPSSLEPGHNKNALYGPAYWPHRDDAP